MSAENDKRELLKLKQGLIDSSDSIDESGYNVAMPKTASEKTKNWFSYNKLMLIIAGILLIIGVIVYFVLFKAEKPDIRIYAVDYYPVSVRNNLCEKMKDYVTDINGNGERLITIDCAPNDTALSSMDIYNEIEKGSCDIFIGTKKQLTSLYDDIKKADNRELFREIAGTGTYLLDIKESAFGKRAQIFSLDLCIAVKNTDGKNVKQVLDFVNNLLTGEKIYIEKSEIDVNTVR